MKPLPAFLLTTVAAAGLATARAQDRSDSTFSVIEEKSILSPDGSKACYDPRNPGRGYQHTRLSFRGDSVFVSQSPMDIIRQDTLCSEMPCGFHYWSGNLQRDGNSIVIHLRLVSCDYCPMNMRKGPDGQLVPVVEEREFTGHSGAAGLWLNEVLFRKEK